MSDPLARLALLEAENADLRALLARATIFPREWRLTVCESKMLAALVTGGGVCSRDKIAQYLWGNDVRCDNNLSVHISRMRRKLDRFGIKVHTKWSDGYALSQTSLEKVRTALSLEVRATGIQNGSAAP